MIYVYFYAPDDSDVPEIVGAFICNSNAEAEERIKETMPEDMKAKGYRSGGCCFDEKNTVNNHFDFNNSTLSVRMFNDDGTIRQ